VVIAVPGNIKRLASIMERRGGEERRQALPRDALVALKGEGLQIDIHQGVPWRIRR
jgi:hypothetical protein